MRIPTRLLQLPNFAKELVSQQVTLLMQPKHPPTTFHLCFFSCESYFPYLYCSIHSLNRKVKHSLRFLVFSDTDQPLSETQIDTLKELSPNLTVISWPKSMGWGTQQIQNIWDAYTIAAQHAKPQDYVARVDSDVFFFNDRIFRLIERSQFDLIGDGHYVDMRYTQGGCYFFSAPSIQEIKKTIQERQLGTILAPAGVNVEDQAAHYLAALQNKRIKLTWFMMFPDELRNAGGLTRWQRMKFSCIHFVMKNKNLMLECYIKEELTTEEHESFTKAITTK
jgi:hypothetical protein